MQKTITVCLATLLTLSSSWDIGHKNRYIVVEAFDRQRAGILDTHTCRFKIDDYILERFDGMHSSGEWIDMTEILDILENKSITDFRMHIIHNHMLDYEDKCR